MKNWIRKTGIATIGVLTLNLFIVPIKAQVSLGICRKNISYVKNTNEKSLQRKKDLERQKDAPYFSESYREYYIKENEIDIPVFKESKKVKKYLDNCEKDEPVNIMDMGFFTSYYMATDSDSEYIYYGELKHDKPHGLGVIKKKMVLDMEKDGTIGGIYSASDHPWLENPVLCYATVYAGYMEKGKKNGYGMFFSLPDNDSDTTLGKELLGLSDILYQNIDDDPQKSVTESLNPLIYEGGFKSDEYNGAGVEYLYLTLLLAESGIGTGPYEQLDEVGQEFYNTKNGKVIGVIAGEWKKGEQIKGEMQTEDLVKSKNGKNKASVPNKNEDIDIYEIDYIFPESNNRFLTDDEIKSVDINVRQMAINEIYARHGRKFNTPEIQEYFDTKDWYKGSVEPEKFSESVLNAYEKMNIEAIADSMGNVAVEHPLADYQ